jgi:hypothetical protein
MPLVSQGKTKPRNSDIRLEKIGFFSKKWHIADFQETGLIQSKAQCLKRQNITLMSEIH